MHSVHDVGERETLVRQEFLEFVSGITVNPVPGSSNPAHIQENIESFSFTLSDDEMKQIAALNKEKRYFNMSYEQIKSWMGDYKLWD